MIIIGTSGWQYASWREIFYPKGLPAEQWLPYFSARFPTVEVNNSFYMLPKEESFDRWRERSAPGFVVTVKANRFITHIKRLKDATEPTLRFWERARRLREKLGPILFQLPPRFKADVPRLRAFIEELPPEMVAAFEFRDPTWESDEVYEVLDAAGAALVIPDRPSLRAPKVVTGGWSYIRFHQGAPLGPWYPREKLRRWADHIADMKARDVYVYFNNDPEGAAIRDAVVLAELLRVRGVELAPVRALEDAMALPSPPAI